MAQTGQSKTARKSGGSGSSPGRGSGGGESASSDGSRVFILAVVGIVVAGLAVIAFVATRGGDDTAADGADAETQAEGGGDAETDSGDDAGADDQGETQDEVAENAPVTVDGDSIASMERGVPVSRGEGEAAVGTIAPTLTGTSFDGSEVVIEPDGRPKVVYFLAHWCPHCQREVPAILDLVAQGAKPDGLDIYAVSTAVDSGGPNYPPSAWLAAEGFDFPVMRDDENASALNSYGPSGFPYAVYLDGDNRVVAQTAGEIRPEVMEDLWVATAATAG